MIKRAYICFFTQLLSRFSFMFVSFLCEQRRGTSTTKVNVVCSSYYILKHSQLFFNHHFYSCICLLSHPTCKHECVARTRGISSQCDLKANFVFSPCLGIFEHTSAKAETLPKPIMNGWRCTRKHKKKYVLRVSGKIVYFPSAA